MQSLSLFCFTSNDKNQNIITCRGWLLHLWSACQAAVLIRAAGMGVGKQGLPTISTLDSQTKEHWYNKNKNLLKSSFIIQVCSTKCSSWSSVVASSQNRVGSALRHMRAALPEGGMRPPPAPAGFVQGHVRRVSQGTENTNNGLFSEWADSRRADRNLPAHVTDRCNSRSHKPQIQMPQWGAIHGREWHRSLLWTHQSGTQERSRV